ncbi:hypothetical protein KC19_VG141200 [Ceratodon purpureus]|uniref:Uncharacterized protein n=1 Tax=Ceratodon purpureus TaxID=3225 RepID=A0A8T0HQ94_CERPU|nr:hypothetical protein KC19_VG141200 [Ceratodon purpureus]
MTNLPVASIILTPLTAWSAHTNIDFRDSEREAISDYSSINRTSATLTSRRFVKTCSKPKGLPKTLTLSVNETPHNSHTHKRNRCGVKVQSAFGQFRYYMERLETLRLAATSLTTPSSM